MSNNNKKLAIALCRVSTQRQLLDGNLEPQEARINQAADALEVEIVKLWGLAISSRKGKNIKRKDLLEMQAYCRQHKAVKYLIVDEVDRFMRSVDEYYYWKVEFKNIGVQLVHANKPNLNPDDPMAVFEELIDVYKAEQSNNERITKTPEKMIAKIMAGYYPGNPRTGYKTSNIKSLHVRDEPTWSILQTTLQEIASGEYTVSQGLKRLHDRGHRTRKFGPRTVGGRRIDMNRFKQILIEPYYAGTIKMSDWPIKKNGLHEAMITEEEHERLVEIVSGKGKKFTHNAHNPEFPLSNTMECRDCLTASRLHPRLVGYRHSNGKKGNSHKEYMRYKCRGCKRNILRDDLHTSLDERLLNLILPDDYKEQLKSSLRKVWRHTAEDNLQRKTTLTGRLNSLREQKNQLVLKMAQEEELEDDFRESLGFIKKQITTTEQELERASDVEKDFMEFTDFALGYIENWQKNWWKLSYEDMERCKQLLFPAGFSLDDNKKVYTPEISIVYRYKDIGKASIEAEIVQLEGHQGFEPWTRGLRVPCSNQLS
jgi:DNA invertase Pin-like site-specific DNA recombinase